jgi:hypothetical protein
MKTASSSRAGPGEGVTDPEAVENIWVDPEDDEYSHPNENPVLVMLWDGSEYDRETCWMQVDADKLCNLNAYL